MAGYLRKKPERGAALTWSATGLRRGGVCRFALRLRLTPLHRPACSTGAWIPMCPFFYSLHGGLMPFIRA